jgi:thiol-disulfide isomerase/thioredoxin
MAAVRAPLHRLPARLGQLLMAPRAALRRIDAEGGGFADAVALVVAGTIAFRLPELIQVLLAAAGPTSGALLRLVAPFATEVRDAAWIVLPASLLVTLLAGARRDPGRDLELGAASYQVFFVVLGLSRAVDAVAGMRVLPPRVTWTIAAAAAIPALLSAIRVARARPARGGDAPAGPPAGSPPGGALAPGKRAAWAGWAVVSLALVGVGGNAVWSARHFDALRPIHRGEAAPDFSLARIDDVQGSVAMSGLRGQVVVLDFWATWCPPCVAMVPVLRDVQARTAPRGVAFIGINSDGPTPLDEIRAFVAAHRLPYPMVIDDGRVGSLYKVEALPTLVIVGRDGRIRESFVGYTTPGTLEKAIAAAESAPAAPQAAKPPGS